MVTKKIRNNYLIRLDKGDEIISSIEYLCLRKNIKTAKIQGIGATNFVKIGLFHTDTKKYSMQEFHEDLEILNLNGNVTYFDNKPYIHLHITLANNEKRCLGGHLNFAIISATAEIFLEVFESEIIRKNDINSGLNLIEL